MPALTLVDTGETFSTYRDQDGELVYLANGAGFRRLTLFEDLNLLASWREYANHPEWQGGDGWLNLLRETTTDPDAVDGILWCIDCDDVPAHKSDFEEEDFLCSTCVVNWSTCDRCEERTRDGLTTTLDNEDVCGSCRGADFTWCGPCEGWYLDGDADDHDHDSSSGCDCESPAQTFTVRNDGDEPLANDKRVTVTLPAGIISAEGMTAISRHLNEVAYDVYNARVPGRDTNEAFNQRRAYYQLAQESTLEREVGATWQTRKGNFTKRLSRFAFQNHALKLPPKVVSRIGCIARDHSTANDYHLEVTRDLNLSAADFGHEDSCWWGGYEEGRCTLKSNGGFGIRTFKDLDCDSHADNVTGRAWVMPLSYDPLTEPHRALSPTFRTTNVDAFVVFNGYGALSGYAPARIFAHMAGMTYRKINFGCTPMWVNGASGYLVAPEHIAASYTDGSLNLHLHPHANLFQTEGVLANVA